ncbi:MULTISPECIES: PucR family transcriptional regulator [unclassified Streptomyces]|uniref:PucR family transcriptional regulator n=1 Tax=unclassified Streptomyces TaxID=2593676 RepID=UPI002E1A00C2
MDTCTLGNLLDALGGSTLRLLRAPHGRAVPVTEVLLHDPHTPLPERAPGALLLAVGVRAGEAGPLVRDAGRAGMAGVVVRGDGSDAVPDAEAAGAALLGTDRDAAWHQVFQLLSSVVGAHGTRTAPLGEDALPGDLFALANAVAAAVGGAIAVEDLGRQILAYSTVPGQPVDETRRQGILGRQVPGSPENDEDYRRLYAAEGPLKLPGVTAEELPRLATTVRAGGELLGSIWAVDTGSLAADAGDALRQGASAAAMLLLRARAADELARHLSSDLLRRLLDGSIEPAAAAHRLGLAPDAPVRVAAFALAGAATAQDGGQAALRLLDLVRLQCQTRYGQHACVLLDGVVYALLPVVGGADHAAERHLRIAEDIVRRAEEALRISVRAGLGHAVPGVAGVRDSRDDADLVLRVLGAGQVADAGQVRAQTSLLVLGEFLADRRDQEAGPWRDVLAHDAEHGTEYARTLICWLDAGCDAGRAAERLVVHPNTCRYRLRKVQRQLGIDLDDPDQRLVLWVQLRTLAGLRG